MTSTPVQNANNVRPFAQKSQFNPNKITITPNAPHFLDSQVPIRYSEITARIVDWVALPDPIDITTGIPLHPQQPIQKSNHTNNNNNSSTDSNPSPVKQSIYFRISIEAHHIRHEMRGYRDHQEQWVQTEADVSYVIQWNIYRRYHEFHSLYDALSTYYQNIPAIPPKEYFSKVPNIISKETSPDITFHTKRMLGLSQWLNTILQTIPAILHCEDIDDFLQIHQHIVVDTSEFPQRAFRSNPDEFCYGITDMIWDINTDTVHICGEDNSYRAKAESKSLQFFATTGTHSGALRSFAVHDDLHQPTITYTLEEFNSPHNGQNTTTTNTTTTTTTTMTTPNDNTTTNHMKSNQFILPIDLNSELKVMPLQQDKSLYPSRASALGMNRFESFEQHLPLLQYSTLPQQYQYLFPSTLSPTSLIRLPTTHIQPSAMYIPRTTRVLADPSTLQDPTNPLSQYINTTIITKAESSNDLFIFVGLDNGEVHISQYIPPTPENDIRQSNYKPITTYKPHTNRIEKISYIHLYPTPLSKLDIDKYLSLQHNDNDNNNNNNNINNNNTNDPNNTNSPTSTTNTTTTSSLSAGFEGILTSSRDGQINFYDLKSGKIFSLLNQLITKYGPIAHHYWNQYTQTLYFTTFNGYIVSYNLLINTRDGSLLPQPLHATQYYSDCIRQIKLLPSFMIPNGYETYSTQLFAVNNYETNCIDIIDFEHRNQSQITLYQQENFPKILFSIPLLKHQCKRILLLPLYLPPQQKITVNTCAVSYAQPFTLYKNNTSSSTNPTTNPTTTGTTSTSTPSHTTTTNAYIDLSKNATTRTPFYYLLTGHSNGLVTISILNIYKQIHSLLYVFNAHNDEITGLQYVPQRDLIVTTSRDKCVSGWRLPFPRSFIERIL